MVAPAFVLVLVAMAWVSWQQPRAALVMLVSGVAALLVIGLLSVTRGVWPDLPLPWALVLNPYLVVTWGFVGTAAGAIGVIRHGWRRAVRR